MTKSLRRKGQILPVVGVLLVVLMTLGNAAANMIPFHRPTQAELQQETVDQRKLRIAELRKTPDRCQPATSHELVRLLVQDGQWSDARSYADDYEQRCGADPVVRHWGNAPVPRVRR